MSCVRWSIIVSTCVTITIEHVFEQYSVWAANPPNNVRNIVTASQIVTRDDKPQDPVIAEYSKCSLGYLKIQIQVASLAIAKNSKNYVAYKRRGLAYWKLESCHRATEDLAQVVKLAPLSMSPDDYRVLGQCYAEDGSPTEAVKIFDETLRLYPKYQGVFLPRSGAHALLKEFDKAIADANRVVDFNRTSAWSYDYRAKLNFSAGRYQRVVDDCSTSIRLQPNSFNPYSLRAKAYAKLGKNDLADKDKQRLNKFAKMVF